MHAKTKLGGRPFLAIKVHTRMPQASFGLQGGQGQISSNVICEQQKQDKTQEHAMVRNSDTAV